MQFADDLQALAAIVEQLVWCGFECEAGPLENNTAFQELITIAARWRPNTASSRPPELAKLWDAAEDESIAVNPAEADD